MKTRDVSEKGSLRRHRPMPKQKLLGKFVDFYVQRPHKNCEDRLSVDAVRSFYSPFTAAYQRVIGTRFDKAESSVVKAVRTMNRVLKGSTAH